jgi:excisionase family DNA binding protein
MKYLTVTEAAEILRCSDRFVLDELRRKNLRGSKVPGWRISEVDLDVYIDAKANVRSVRKAS